jgi:glyoxylase-like metal-dependent hydrolase (beta-lactamase superfamily II)
MSDIRSGTRRAFLSTTGAFGGAALIAHCAPGLVGMAFARGVQAPDPAVEKMRAQMGGAAIETTRLADGVSMLSGPGGNVVVLAGKEGKVVVDGFVQPAWPRLKSALDAIDGSPIKTMIDTHWHFDHADNNANFSAAGARVLAHANTRTRLGETHDLLGMHFEPAPAAALPTDTFADRRSLTVNGEQILLAYVPPAHTDTDILVHFTNANVLHMGDLFFNGTYPFIDASTRGHINGMISGADRALQMVNDLTRIVPGHGPLGDRAALQKYRTMLVTVRDRIRAQKAKGATLEEVQAAKPTVEFDAAWGKGMIGGNDFVALVYSTLPIRQVVQFGG